MINLFLIGWGDKEYQTSALLSLFTKEGQKCFGIGQKQGLGGANREEQRLSVRSEFVLRHLRCQRLETKDYSLYLLKFLDGPINSKVLPVLTSLRFLRINGVMIKIISYC